ncbi:MAG: LPS export ABC transporter permease LptF [Trichlorobacter sp.]|jgi:lipopolysaccharide export system permease protein
MKNRIVSLYLMREVTGIFLLGLSIFTLVLLMGRMVKLMEMVVSNGVPVLEVLRLIGYLLPSFLVLTIPMALLLAVLLAIGRLSADNEITVLKSSGLSLAALLPPVLLCAVVAALLTLFISLVAVPWGNTGFKQFSLEVARTYASAAIKERIFRDDLPGIVMYVDQYDEQQHQMKRVMIQDERDPQRPMTIFARDGVISSDEAAGTMRILLRNGSIHTQDARGGYRLISFGDYLLVTELGKTSPLVRTELDLSATELLQVARAQQTSSQARNKALTELHSRFAFPAAALVFAILALPLGISNRRSGKGAGFTASILILLVYYVLLSFLRTFAEKGSFPPVLAIWLPNLLFLVIGVVLFRLAVQERSVRDLLMPSRKGV